MPGYLDQYGAGEEDRNRLIIRSIVAGVVVVAVTALSWYLLKNHHQEGVVKTFLADVRRGDYQAAYRDWGCMPAKSCSGYDFDKFSEDWGAKAKDGAPDPGILGIADSESCGTGVLLTVNVNAARQERLWVDKTGDGISFAPYPICPFKSPFAIMMHRTIGRLRKPLLR
jgi:hypothetical protein